RGAPNRRRRGRGGSARVRLRRRRWRGSKARGRAGSGVSWERVGDRLRFCHIPPQRATPGIPQDAVSRRKADPDFSLRGVSAVRYPVPMRLPRPALLLALILPAFARSGDAPRPADQRDYPDSANGCAPATLLNFLQFAGPEYGPALKSLVGATDGVRMRFLVDRYYRHRPSAANRNRMRWGVHGIGCDDFAAGIAELLADHGLAPPASASLDREEGESEAEHLARVHGMMRRSLAAETPP